MPAKGKNVTNFVRKVIDDHFGLRYSDRGGWGDPVFRGVVGHCFWWSDYGLVRFRAKNVYYI